MKTRNIFLSAFAALAVLAIGFASCSKTDLNRPGQFRVLLTDAPGDYIAAEIDIVKVEVKVMQANTIRMIVLAMVTVMKMTTAKEKMNLVSGLTLNIHQV